ncbi:DNA adenine methylase [Porphyromonas gulae]|uniref:Site-specific DNA-methyltransferase (adenine-specific) n=1 Tax=Porphyromonas gulae TaxID=111105 RepID=A0A0A2FMT8_9PORP|nr:Dam family site-specific DNA-(adenine-N6)-methyltransferase [Porphyromonas gulae]KGN69768.1 DNA adenine methylase [Porphyromonas gulae]KGN73265.1 DNA adenine methylase [Porphyromonas gulae]KGN81090.1 DNA adenine methylase [Porphyromonas gulae]KGN85598.1 DNA adenine methylase [Porphyromonas gulae]KGN89619.1 DNA adenine methylase [Porphyromonas gulae]
MPVITPPIKSQGIKTKLIPWILELIESSGLDLEHTNWIEPFLGTGVVGLNIPIGGKRIVGDTNPHIINFYNALKEGRITPINMRAYLESEGVLLANSREDGCEHYRKIRNRFNEEQCSFDFLFLSRAGFNGMMRFNKMGHWNIPFCKKPNRFSPAYVTKICNQIAAAERIIKGGEWEFCHQDFVKTIQRATKGDIIYCDPPYFGRYVDYYNGWTEEDEERLFLALKQTPAHFILSTWHHNEFRKNEMIERFWGQFNVKTQDHFYHSGARIENRRSIVEALIYNFDIDER